jgi:hypothetical protein
MYLQNAPSDTGSMNNNGTGRAAQSATPGLLGGMDLSTISALVVLASAFMRR